MKTRIPFRHKNKYGATKTKIDGVTFDSKAEADYYQQLKLLMRAGEVKDIILQPRYELLKGFEKHGKKIRGIEYVADFKVIYADGREEIIDVKGKRTEVYTIKRKWFESKYPELTIKEVQA
jgi:hypothetical protein